jgi:hypothetical protein
MKEDMMSINGWLITKDALMLIPFKDKFFELLSV